VFLLILGIEFIPDLANEWEDGQRLPSLSFKFGSKKGIFQAEADPQICPALLVLIMQN